VFRTVVQAISRVFGYSHVSLFLLQGDRLMLQHQVGYRDVIREIPLTQGISGRVARTGRPVLLKNVRSDPDFIKVTEGIVSELCIPLFDQGKIAGTLNVETTEATPLGEADLEALSALGQHVGIAIAKARLYAAARESEERYRSLVEALGEGIGIVDPNETFTFANPAAEVVFGVPPGGLAGRSLRDFLSEEEFRRTLSETRRRRQGEKTTYELEIRRSDGEARRIELTATPRVDAAGAFVGTLGIFHDVTEYRRLQKSLEQERGLLLTLINSLPDYIYLKDRESRFILVNQAQAELVGVADARALVGRTDRDFVPEELAERYRLDDLRVMESGRSLINIEEPSRSSAGYLRWVLTTKVPIIDSSGAVTGLVGISRDITERKEAVEKLGNFIEQSPEAIVLTDEEGIVIEYNLSAEKLMGIPRTEALGMSAWALTKAVTIRRPASPRYVPALQDRFRSALREGAASFLNRQMAGSLRRPDGAIRQFEQYNFCIRTSKGFQLGSISRDVTEARQTEAALRASEEQLAQAQKLEAVGRLAGGIAHDFNNLLTVIKGYAELINSKLDQGSPALGDVMEIKRTAQRAADLTSQLLAFSRKQVLQPTVIKATDVVRGMQEMLLRIIGEDISLSAVLPPDTGNVRADRGRMEQVIMNLAANARDAMPQGGRLTIETGNVTLSEAEARERPELAPGDYVLLTVQDTGVGIDRETLPRIFEPFFTTKAAGKGTGLGLATVYGVVTQSGGAIACESEPGAGTTFRIWLPRVLEEVAGGERPEKVTGAPGGSETILLVEDEETMRRFARSVLEASGYVVIEAASGEEALAALSRGGGAASLLLSDVVMPGMSGPQLGRAVARIRPGVRILYMSGYAEESLAGHGMLEPGIDLLQKPFDASTLLARVRAAIDRT
jgi:PAS domain S-box-containing protein